MSTNRPAPLSPAKLQTDEAAFIALKQMTTYAPANQSYTVLAAQSLADAMTAAHAAEKIASDLLDAKRDASAAAEQASHEAIQGVKDQVIAQYRENSDEVASLGLKKRIEYKRPARKAAAKTAA